MPKKLLEIQNLSLSFHNKKEKTIAIQDVSFELYQGETLGIVGESGSGKSVTAKSIMRLIPSPPGEYESGKIIYHPLEDGNPKDLLTLSSTNLRRLRGRQIGMIFQEPMTALNPVFTCGHQVAEALKLHLGMNTKAAKEKTLDLFEKVQLPNPTRIYKAYPHQISGGQKQRVMIAMAMSCNPDILIADEPTTALDVTVQKSILALMNDLKSTINAGIIFITHDLGVIAEVADRVLVMYKGRIVEQGKIKDIFEAPKHPYTKGLLACRPPMDFKLDRLPTVSDFMEVEKKGEALIISEKTFSNIKKEISPIESALRNKNLQAKPPLLQVENLQTWFPSEKNLWGKPTAYIKAVNEVSFEVYQGETLGIVGESGCGKTTLGRTILQLLQAKSGKIIYDKKNLATLTAKEMKAIRKDLQIIFQDPYSALNPRMTIAKALVEPMEIHKLGTSKKDRLDRAAHLLEQVGLETKHLTRYPHEFSGGQRQRICIARTLAVEPKLIVCDESVSALDVSVQAQVLNVLIDLRDKFDLTYLFISHDLSVVKFMSDRILVMKDGKIEELADADTIYTTPSSPYTKELINAIPKGL